MQMFAGLGDTGLGLQNEEVSDNVFGNLAEPVLGLPAEPRPLPGRAGVLGGQPDHHLPAHHPHAARDGRLRRDARSGSPTSTRSSSRRARPPSRPGSRAAVFYTVMTILSERVLTDTILSLGIMICFYYGLVAFGCIWFFRTTLFDNAFNVDLQVPVPAARRTRSVLRADHHPEGQRRARTYGSGASVFGIGLVLVLGLGPHPDRHRRHARACGPGSRRSSGARPSSTRLPTT